MKQLLLIKEKIKQFVGKNDIFIIPVLKFLLTLFSLRLINNELGYMARLNSKPITLIIALAGSFLPPNLTIVILALVALAHVYALSMECAIIVLALFMILFLLYFRFAAKDSVAVLLTPICFSWNIPYILPVSMGLVSGPSSVVSVGSGVIVYNVLHYISQNAEDIKNIGGSGSKITAVKDIADALIGNKNTYVYVLAFGVTIIVVHIIRKMSFNYCWFVAIGVGAILDVIMIAVGNSKLGGSVSVGGAFAGLFVAVLVNLVIQYFCFDLDYNRTEKVQFEDDEYYYYVKAVPKNTIKLPSKKKKSSKTSSGKTTSGKTASGKPTSGRTSTGKVSSSVASDKTAASGPAPARKSSNIQPARRNSVEDDSESRHSSARETVVRNATNKAHGAERGFLGMTGGRTAGEGYRKELREKEQKEQQQKERNDAAARSIVDDFTDDNN